MNKEEILVAEIKGLLKALDDELVNVRFNLSIDNVHDIKQLKKAKAYLKVIVNKMRKYETETDELY